MKLSSDLGSQRLGLIGMDVSQAKVIRSWGRTLEGSSKYQQISVHSGVSFCLLLFCVDVYKFRVLGSHWFHSMFQVGHHDPCGCCQWKATACSLSGFKAHFPLAGSNFSVWRTPVVFPFPLLCDNVSLINPLAGFSWRQFKDNDDCYCEPFQLVCSFPETNCLHPVSCCSLGFSSALCLACNLHNIASGIITSLLWQQCAWDAKYTEICSKGQAHSQYCELLICSIYCWSESRSVINLRMKYEVCPTKGRIMSMVSDFFCF